MNTEQRRCIMIARFKISDRVFIAWVLLLLSFAMSCTSTSDRVDQRSDESIHTLIRQSLNIDELDPFLHTEIEGRGTLFVAGGDIQDRGEFLRKGQLVKIVSPSSLEMNLVYFHRIERDSFSAYVEFEYKIEGVWSNVYLTRNGDIWHIDSVRLFET